MHKPNSWVSQELSTLKTLALVLKSSISIANPNPKVDEGLHVSPSGVHHGGTIKVIVAGLLRTGTMKKHEKSPPKLLPPRRAPLPIRQPPSQRRNRQHQKHRPPQTKTRPAPPRPRSHPRSPRERLSPRSTGDVPDAKVVLTERTSAALWLRSWRGFGVDLRSDCFRWIGYWVPGVVSANDLYRGWMRLASERFGLAPEPSEELYHAHNNWVKSIVPEERLLVFKCQGGWEPLCRFLGRQRPNLFPHGNEAGHLKYYKRVAMGLGIALWMIVFTLFFFLMSL